MKFENAIIYNGKFYRVGEEVPVAEKIEKATDESTTAKPNEKVEDSIDESTTVEKVSKRRTKAKAEVN